MTRLEGSELNTICRLMSFIFLVLFAALSSCSLHKFPVDAETLAKGKDSDIQTCRVLSFGGGGIHGAWEAGVITPLVEAAAANNIYYNWDVIGGVSAGSINAICSLFPGKNGVGDIRWVNLLWEKWRTVTGKEISKNCGTLNIPRILSQKITSVLWKKLWKQPIETGICDAEALRKTILKTMEEGDYERADHSVVVSAVRVRDGEYVSYNENNSNEELANAVVASSAVPVFFETAKIEDDIYVDGGVLSMNNVNDNVIRCLEINNFEVIPNCNSEITKFSDCILPDNNINKFEVVIDYVVTSITLPDYSGTSFFDFLARTLELLRIHSGGLNPLIRALRKYEFVKFRCILSPTEDEINRMPGPLQIDDMKGRESLLQMGALVGENAAERTRLLVDWYMPEDLKHRSIPCVF